MPTTSSGVGGVGDGKHHLQIGDWVFGFFADGEHCQQPVVIGVIPGAGGPGVSGSGVSPGSSGSTTGDTSSTGGSNDSNIAPAKNVPTGERPKIVYQKLRALGYTHVQACGIMGNLQQESAGFNTSAEGDKKKAAHAHGIAQWRNSDKTPTVGRWTNLQNFARSKGKSPNDLETQVEFIKHELSTSESIANARLGNAHTVEDAARAFVAFERPQGYNAKAKNAGDASRNADGMTNRIANAKAFDKQFAGQGTAASTPKTAADKTPGV